MEKFKSYKYRIYPNQEQLEYFAKAFGSARFIYNKMLEDKIKHYELHKENFYSTPAQYKGEFPWLSEVDSNVLANAKLQLDQAYKNFFRNPSHFGRPTFKKKMSRQKFKTTKATKKDNIRIENGGLRIPRVKETIKMKMSQPLPEKSVIRNVTIEKTPSGKYFAIIMVKIELEVKPQELKRVLGIDYSIPHLFVTSDGVIGGDPKYYRKSQSKLAREQRKLSKMEKGSNNYNKQKIKVGKIHEYIANQRHDYLHKTSREIANFYDVVCVEGLNMKAMAQRMNFGKSVNDGAWASLVFYIQYKLEEQGKKLIVADKWFPSTKQCSNCKNKKDMSLDMRTYECDVCGLDTDRDLNAAINLKNYAIELLNI